MSTALQRDTINKLNNAFNEFKHFHERSKEEINKLGHETTETRSILEKIHDRMDDLETKSNRIRIHGEVNREKTAYDRAFSKWFKTGCEESKNILMQEVKVNFPNLNETIDPMGGYFLPPNMLELF